MNPIKSHSFINRKNEDKNTYLVKLLNKNNEELEIDMFCKFSPLLDPVKYMMGKYENNNINNMPKFINDTDVHEKILNENNTAYIDGLFTPKVGIQCEAVVGGDRKLAEISAASIVAKVARDFDMDFIIEIVNLALHVKPGQ